jgi:hypothetical protein
VFLLALHIVAIGVLVVFVWAIAHGRGERVGERRLRRRLGLDEQARASASQAGPPSASQAGSQPASRGEAG